MGYIFGLLSVVFFGLNAPVTKVLIDAGISSSQVAFVRELVPVTVSAVWLLLFERKSFRITKKQLIGVAAIGLFAVTGAQIAYGVAVSKLPVGIALLIEYTGIILVALYATIVWREPTKRRLWPALAMVIFGLAIVANVWGSALDPLGILAASIAAVGIAAYFLLGEKILNHLTLMGVLFWTMLFAALAGLFAAAPWNMDFALLVKPVSLGGNLAGITAQPWMLMLWSAVMGTLLTYILSYLSIQRLKATPAAVIAVGEVLFAFLFGWLWLGEVLTTSQLIGGAIVIVGIVVAQTARANHPIDLTLAPADFQIRDGRDASASAHATAKSTTSKPTQAG